MAFTAESGSRRDTRSVIAASNYHAEAKVSINPSFPSRAHVNQLRACVLFPSFCHLVVAMAEVEQEKGGHEKSLAEHREEAIATIGLGKGSIDGRSGFAEEVHYGYGGAKGLLSSPYVFGAALLASMGGFSYGYGRYQMII